MNLWLDDIRPCPVGWTGVTTIAEAKRVIESGEVDQASLDHDLGACEICLDGESVDEWMARNAYQSMPYCSHVGTGYDLCLWMAETGIWPNVKPVVHSMNPVGRERMRGVIDRYFPAETQA